MGSCIRSMTCFPPNTATLDLVIPNKKIAKIQCYGLDGWYFVFNFCVYSVVSKIGLNKL